MSYVRYTPDDLKKGVQLEPPTEAHRAYISAEVGTVRWAFSIDADLEPMPHLGMPIEAGNPAEEFDTDLPFLQLWAGSQDAIAHVYYFRSS